VIPGWCLFAATKKAAGRLPTAFAGRADSGYGGPLQNKTAGIAPAAIVLHRKLSNGEQAQYGKDQCQTHQMLAHAYG
jgi:hypothetical protein